MSVFLPAIFKSGMVLQTPEDGGAPASLFGYARAGETVVVNMTIAARSAVTFRATGDALSGRWSVVVSPPAGSAPAPDSVSFSIAASSDTSPTIISNASFGEVILCNGQSNLVLSVAAASNPVGRAAPPSPQLQYRTFPNIRLFSVITANSTLPSRDLPPYINRTASRCTWGYVANMTPAQAMVCQEWQVAAPGVTDFFSAECFYSAYSLYESGAIPADRVTGLIQSAYSGTAMEVWIPPEALDGCPAKPWRRAAAAAAPLGNWSPPVDPGCLWNDMILPIVGYGLRAVLHNQIESNMGDSFEYYACVFQGMIRSWRRYWGIGDIPFLTTGLGDQGFSPDDGGKNVGFPSYVAVPRDGQGVVVPGRYPGISATPAAGIVSAYDVGDRVGNPNGVWDVHARFKGEIGRRMALVFSNVTGLGARGGSIAWDGPVPASPAARAADGSITLAWTGVGDVYMNGTQDCWECCDGGRALDTFQVSTVLPAGNMSRYGPWVNASWAVDVAATVVITPVKPAPAGLAWVAVRYAASLWPQCAWYARGNGVPARAFSDLAVTAARTWP